jgi:hypothetical protein
VCAVDIRGLDSERGLRDIFNAAGGERSEDDHQNTTIFFFLWESMMMAQRPLIVCSPANYGNSGTIVLR